MAIESPTDVAIVAILREAKQGGFTPLLRTTLHKLVYLLDLYFAEETQGRTFTNATWKFLHFGPYGQTVADAMERLARERHIFVEQRASAETDVEYSLYSPWREEGPTLREAVPGSVALRIASDLRRFGRNLPALLDYVYFRTAPMAPAKPGDVLDFRGCEKLSIADFRPVQMLTIRNSQIRQVRQIIHEILERASGAPQRALPIGPFDDVYDAGLKALNGESLSTGLSGRARIEID